MLSKKPSEVDVSSSMSTHMNPLAVGVEEQRKASSSLAYQFVQAAPIRAKKYVFVPLKHEEPVEATPDPMMEPF